MTVFGIAVERHRQSGGDAEPRAVPAKMEEGESCCSKRPAIQTGQENNRKTVRQMDKHAGRQRGGHIHAGRKATDGLAGRQTD